MALSIKHRKLAVAGALAGTFTASLHKANGAELTGSGYTRVSATKDLSAAEAKGTFSAQFPAATAAWPDVTSVNFYDSTNTALLTAPIPLFVGGTALSSINEAEVLSITGAEIALD